MVSCREFLQLMLDGWLAATLPRHRQRACDEHVATCHACTDYVDSYRVTVGMLRRHRAAERTPAVPEDLVRAIVAQHSGS
ncbi:MAG: hypothetical protein JNM25_10870 [Planctomycetes bacterium]|nr:hypothetical protein [Planctomycetota bacterium]